ncbi:MAG: hypothetical protein ACI4A5_08245 [Hominilimicola sp.]
MKMPETYKIQVKYFQSQNYTPSDVMRRWAMENYEKFFTDWQRGSYIHMMGGNYYYDHWEIDKHKDETETVTVYLKKK